MPKILTLDIETRPALSYHWRMFKENISIEQNVEPTGLMCVAAKWMDEDDVKFWSTWTHSKYEMLSGLRDLLLEADAVVGWHSDGFDLPHINTEFLLEGLEPIPPVTSIDLYKTVRAKMFFLSNKLDFVARALRIGKKKEHEGFKLWRGCLEGDEAARKKMEEYNIQDVRLTEEVYEGIRPFITNHPYIQPSSNGNLECPACGSEKHEKRGFRYTAHYQIQRHHCKNCGHWFQGSREKTTGPRPAERREACADNVGE